MLAASCTQTRAGIPGGTSEVPLERNFALFSQKDQNFLVQYRVNEHLLVYSRSPKRKEG
jgi:hypothetical protein